VGDHNTSRHVYFVDPAGVKFWNGTHSLDGADGLSKVIYQFLKINNDTKSLPLDLSKQRTVTQVYKGFSVIHAFGPDSYDQSSLNNNGVDVSNIVNFRKLIIATYKDVFNEFVNGVEKARRDFRTQQKRSFELRLCFISGGIFNEHQLELSCWYDKKGFIFQALCQLDKNSLKILSQSNVHLTVFEIKPIQGLQQQSTCKLHQLKRTCD